jgi:predicted dehydrogenase
MPETVNRRRFLSTTAAGAAATTFFAPAVFAQETPPSQQITVGVMGLSRGLSLCQTFGRLPAIKLKYVCDVDSQRVASAQSAIEKNTEHRPEGVADFRKILDDPDVDVFVVAAPNHWHAPATILACAAGKHVYVEKPCCHNPREGELMVEAARKHQRAVQMGSQRRSSAGFQEAVRQLLDGVIGRVYLARSWYNNLRPSIGKGQPAAVPPNLDYDLWQGPAPRTPYVDNRVHYNWHWFWHWGNGELGNNGIHALDICRWGLGAEYPIRVTSSGGRYRYEDDQQTPDTHVAAFEFEGGKAATWEGLSCNKRECATGFVAFYGEEGALEIDGSGTFRIYDADDKLVREEKGTYKDADHAGNLLQAIRDNKPLNLNAEILEGHKSTLLCHLGNIAWRTGRVLNCSPTDGRILGDDKAQAMWSREYEPGWEPVV